MMKTSKTIKNSIKIDDITLNKLIIEKFLKKEKIKEISLIDDLNELSTKSESELLNVINQMMQNKNFFKNCYSLLININPGPDYIYDYLNLKDWLSNEDNNININKDNNLKHQIKPHLYSFMQNVYETLKENNKDQVVSILGPLGSGKTFNLIHIMEYFTSLYSYQNNNLENFELIHKSIQFIHILGSIFRENNLESSSCGLLLNLGFNQNNLICSFDIEAQILDYSLPFNEKGRTFSIFHALIIGANEELKRKCKVNMNADNLFNLKNKKNNFYRNDKEKENFKLNDLEIWNKFYSLLKYFHFTKNEMIDVINCFSFILNVNELMITKVKGGKLKNIDYYEIQKGITTKRICTNLGIKIDDKIEEFENIIKEFKFKTLQEAEIILQGLVKQAYYILFEYALQKIKLFINDYFSKINKIYNMNNKIKNIHKTKSIYFIDFPGEVESKNLGGFTTNIAQECLNMYSASSYYEIVEKILLENILLKKFKPLKSYSLLVNCFNKNSIIDNFSKSLNEDNFIDMKQNLLQNLNIYNCYRFPESRKPDEFDYNFYCSFSNKNVVYNYEYLYYESKSLLYNEKINKIFSLANNIVISSMYKSNQTKLESLNSFYYFYTSSILKFFNSIKNIKPFVVYCLHSNDSYKYFFSKKDENKKKILNLKSSDISLDIIKNSMIPAILNWNWHGYKEWIKIDDFLSEYENDFEKVKERIILVNEYNNNIENKSNENNLDFKNFSKNEKAKCILNILARDYDYLLGKEYIIMKIGTLKRIANYFNSMLNTADEISKNILYRLKTANTISNKNNSRKKLKFDNKDKKNSKTKDENISSCNSINKINSFNLEKNIECNPLPQKKDIDYLEKNIYKKNINEKRNQLKEQCPINIIYYENNKLKLLNNDEKNNVLKNKYLNLNSILNKYNRNIKNDEKDKKNFVEELIKYKDERIKKNIPTKKNTIVSDPVIFNKIQSLFDPTKSKNIKLFDYSENVDLIIKIQTIFRSLKAQRKYRILKFISKYIILIQKFIRSLLCRKKVKFFLKCSKCVSIIQKIYKKRFQKLNENAKTIQVYYRAKSQLKKERDKLILKMKLEAEKEKYAYINVDKIMDDILTKKDKDAHNIILNLGKIDNDNINNKNKILKKSKINKVDITNDITNETNKDRIIDLLLYSKLPEDNKRYRKQLKRSKSDYYKIEDKLIYEGEQIKKKREKQIKETQDKKEQELKFKLILSRRNYEITQKYPINFLKRIEYYKLFKKRNVENLRNKLFIDNLNKLNDMRFEPNINYNQYQNIQSKVIAYNNTGKNNRFKNYNDITEDKKVIEDKINNPSKIRSSKSEIKNFYYAHIEQRNIMINEDENHDNSLFRYKNLDIWPKVWYHKYLDSQIFESKENNN